MTRPFLIAVVVCLAAGSTAFSLVTQAQETQQGEQRSGWTLEEWHALGEEKRAQEMARMSPERRAEVMEVYHQFLKEEEEFQKWLQRPKQEKLSSLDEEIQKFIKAEGESSERVQILRQYRTQIAQEPEPAAVQAAAAPAAPSSASVTEVEAEVEQSSAPSEPSVVARSIDYNCFYAGWPSITRAGKCSSPQKARQDYPGGCAPGLTCQPELFGPDLCVPAATQRDRNHAFANCERKFRGAQPPRDFKSLVERLLADTEEGRKARARFEEIVQTARAVCEHQRSWQNAKPMCRKLKERLERILKERDDLKKAEQPEPAAEAAPAPTELSVGGVTLQDCREPYYPAVEAGIQNAFAFINNSSLMRDPESLRASNGRPLFWSNFMTRSQVAERRDQKCRQIYNLIDAKMVAPETIAPPSSAGSASGEAE